MQLVRRWIADGGDATAFPQRRKLFLEDNDTEDAAHQWERNYQPIGVRSVLDTSNDTAKPETIAFRECVLGHSLGNISTFLHR